MSAERITPEEVVRWASMATANEREIEAGIFTTLAQQMRADAHRLAEVEAELSLWRASGYPEPGTVVPRTEYDGVCAQVAGQAYTIESLRADAAEWRALHAVFAHPTRKGREAVAYKAVGLNTVRCECYADGRVVDAPTPTALLAKLDALAEARKPKPETWRFMIGDRFQYTTLTHPSAAECRKYWEAIGLVGHPVREVTNPAGDVLLLREGRPVPTEGGPWE